MMSENPRVEQLKEIFELAKREQDMVAFWADRLYSLGIEDTGLQGDLLDLMEDAYDIDVERVYKCIKCGTKIIYEGHAIDDFPGGDIYCCRCDPNFDPKLSQDQRYIEFHAEPKLEKRKLPWRKDPGCCELCGQSLGYKFVIGKTQYGSVSNMCSDCYLKHGMGIAKGLGQLYEKEGETWFHTR